MKRWMLFVLVLGATLAASAASTYTKRYYACFSSKCEKDYVLTVNVDPQRKVVYIQWHYEGKFVANVFWERCKFFDTQNWNCENEGRGNSLSYSNGALAQDPGTDFIPLK